MLVVFLYVRLWRRSGVMTGIEFSEIRYSGKPAAFLRGFRALYFGIPINCIVLGWVNLEMVKILMLVLIIDKFTAIVVVLFTIGITSWIFTLAGLWGVLVTDAVQLFHQNDDGDRSRRLRGAVYVHHRHPTQLGRQLPGE